MIATAPQQRTGPPRSPPKVFGRTHGVSRVVDRILIYGPGGVGKTTLAAGAPGILFLDTEHGTEDHSIDRASGIEGWADLRAWLNTGDFTGVKTIGIDSVTRAEQWCSEFIVATVPHEKGHAVKRIEDYGWGKGYGHMYEEWRRMLCDLESHYRQGRNIVLVAHDQDGKAPNPDGEDFLRHQPRLLNADKASILRTTAEWCDHVLFINFDSAVKDGKAKGGGSRTIFCSGTPTVIAKTRTLPGDPIPFPKGDNKLWELLAAKPATTDSEAAIPL